MKGCFLPVLLLLFSHLPPSTVIRLLLVRLPVADRSNYPGPDWLCRVAKEIHEPASTATLTPTRIEWERGCNRVREREVERQGKGKNSFLLVVPCDIHDFSRENVWWMKPLSGSWLWSLWLNYGISTVSLEVLIHLIRLCTAWDPTVCCSRLYVHLQIERRQDGLRLTAIWSSSLWWCCFTQ